MSDTTRETFSETPGKRLQEAFRSVAEEDRKRRLMEAAAPDLYEACERIRDEKAPKYHDCIDAGEPECAWCAVFNALAKARGEQSA